MSLSRFKKEFRNLQLIPYANYHHVLRGIIRLGYKKCWLKCFGSDVSHEYGGWFVLDADAWLWGESRDFLALSAMSFVENVETHHGELLLCARSILIDWCTRCRRVVPSRRQHPFTPEKKKKEKIQLYDLLLFLDHGIYTQQRRGRTPVFLSRGSRKMILSQRLLHLREEWDLLSMFV